MRIGVLRLDTQCSPLAAVAVIHSQGSDTWIIILCIVIIVVLLLMALAYAYIVFKPRHGFKKKVDQITDSPVKNSEESVRKMTMEGEAESNFDTAR